MQGEDYHIVQSDIGQIRGQRPNQRTKTKSKAIHKMMPVLPAYFLDSIVGDSPEDAPGVAALIVKFADIFVAWLHTSPFLHNSQT